MIWRLFYGRHGSVNKLERGKEKYTSISKIDIDTFSVFISQVFYFHELLPSLPCSSLWILGVVCLFHQLVLSYCNIPFLLLNMFPVLWSHQVKCASLTTNKSNISRNFPIPRGNAFILKGSADVNHRPPHHAEVASQVHFFDLMKSQSVYIWLASDGLWHHHKLMKQYSWRQKNK